MSYQTWQPPVPHRCVPRNVGRSAARSKVYSWGLGQHPSGGVPVTPVNGQQPAVKTQGQLATEDDVANNTATEPDVTHIAEPGPDETMTDEVVLVEDDKGADLGDIAFYLIVGYLGAKALGWIK
jgi:hypothetical protein